MSNRKRTDQEAMASPLWPLTLVLADIATRLERHHRAEHCEAAGDGGYADGDAQKAGEGMR